VDVGQVKRLDFFTREVLHAINELADWSLTIYTSNAEYRLLIADDYTIAVQKTVLDQKEVLVEPQRYPQSNEWWCLVAGRIMNSEDIKFSSGDDWEEFYEQWWSDYEHGQFWWLGEKERWPQAPLPFDPVKLREALREEFMKRRKKREEGGT